ncbi:MAG: hypothetical protein JWN53_456 [Gemmatimonadetes bacterium]|jgi:hypothetical protein|nr:hypothetical protein [Gemmatimonadota bacterium]
MPPLTEQTMTDTARSSSTATLFAWLAVGLPLAWGVSQTIIKSMALFR